MKKKPTTRKAATSNLKVYSFEKLGIVVEALSLAEAEEKAKELAKENK